MLTNAPIKTPPLAVGSMPCRSRAVMSIKRCGLTTFSFIRSTRLVPPAIKRVDSSAMFTASLTDAGLW
ncbi:hypothetical protein D3C73_1511800 [compost metagenome]